jgi:hypothetical protein
MSDTTVRGIEARRRPHPPNQTPARARNGHKVSDQEAPGGQGSVHVI